MAYLAALRARTDSCMRSALALDQHQGAKGAWRYMFSTGEKTGTCMHYPVRPKHRRFPTPETLRASRKGLFTFPRQPSDVAPSQGKVASYKEPYTKRR